MPGSGGCSAAPCGPPRPSASVPLGPPRSQNVNKRGECAVESAEETPSRLKESWREIRLRKPPLAARHQPQTASV
eukprot:scaffold1437_cov268-Pinguiococcus_pyrenoidosus.AAC.8